MRIELTPDDLKACIRAAGRKFYRRTIERIGHDYRRVRGELDGDLYCFLSELAFARAVGAEYDPLEVDPFKRGADVGNFQIKHCNPVDRFLSVRAAHLSVDYFAAVKGLYPYFTVVGFLPGEEIGYRGTFGSLRRGMAPGWLVPIDRLDPPNRIREVFEP